MQEIWKDIDGFNGKYRISNFGNVMSTNYRNTGKSKLLKLKAHHSGYLFVRLCYGDSRPQKNIYVHVLVAKNFIQNPCNKKCVNHIDGNKHNNHVGNLEWVTHKENTAHAIKTGLFTPNDYEYKRSQHLSACKPILQYDLKGNLVKQWGCISDAAKHYGCLPASICSVAVGRIKSCKGFLWRYKTSENAPTKIIPPYNRLHDRLIIQRTLDNRFVKAWNSYKELSECGYKQPSICACVKGHQHSAYGYKWECVDI